MQAVKQREYKAWLASVGVHIMLFTAVSLAGVFAMVAPPEEKPIEVTLYDADAGGGGGGSSAMAELAPAAGAAMDALVVKQTAALPEIQESFTKSPELQEKFKEQHHAPEAPKHVQVTTANGRALPGLLPGSDSSQGSTGTGQGDGQGSGIGSGEGTGTGSGTGDGVGNGNGSGVGEGSGKGLRPAIPPQRLYAPEPTYPESLRQKNVSGNVRVQITVDTSGSVSGVSILASSGYDAMDQAAVAAAWQYRYSPAYNEYGEAVSFTKRVNMAFQLH